MEIVQVEKSVPKTAARQWMGRKIREREAIARAFVAKMVYKHDARFDNRITRDS